MSHTHAVLGRASGLYLVAGAIALGCYLVVPPFVGSTWLFELVGLSAAVAIAVGVVVYRPRPRAPWLLFLLAQVLFVAGDFFYYTFDLSFPSFADGLYVAYYPLQVAGLVLLIRSRSPGKDWASLIDAVIIAVGFGLLSWIYLIEPYTIHPDDTLMSRLVSMTYPAMDVLLLAVTARLVIGNSEHSRVFRLLAASIVCLIVTDAVYGVIELGGTYSTGSSLDVGWIAAYVLWGAAALHPSMRQRASRAVVPRTALSGKRILLLGLATLIAPATLVANSQWEIAGFDAPVAAVASAVLFVLVLARMWGLVSNLHAAVDRHQRAEHRETVLRHAAAALVSAPDRERIRRAALDGAHLLLQGRSDIQIVVELDHGRPRSETATSAGPDAVVVPLAAQATSYGQLVVSSSLPVPADVEDGLSTLGAQVALALESAELTETLGRQQSDARVGALVQNSSDVIIVVDAQLLIRYVTPSAVRVLGHRPEDLVGQPLPSLMDPTMQAAVTRFYGRRDNRTVGSTRAEWKIRRGDGQFIDVETISNDLLDHPGVHGIVVTARDISERKALEVALKHQVEELEELDHIRNEFVATVSHELRTPLTSIIGQAELLADGALGGLSAGQGRGVDMIDRNSRRLLTLIEDLLTLNNIESSGLKLYRQEIPIAQLVDDVRRQVGSAAAAKPVALTVDYQADAGTVLVDRAQLDRALLNLLTNAVKFTPPGGAVLLKARRDGADLVLTVADSGLGIPEDEQSRLFTRFFRSSVATRMAIQGTGLGLVIVKQIVEEHGGTISIVSAPDVGTTVTIRIPSGDSGELRVGAA